MPEDVQLPDSPAVFQRGPAALSKGVSGSQSWFPYSQLLGCQVILSSGIIFSNQAAHINILHLYFTAAVTEFFLVRVDHKRKKKNILICFFLSLSLLLPRVLKNIFDNGNIFVLPEISHGKQTYLGRPLSSKDLPVSNMLFVSDKS